MPVKVYRSMWGNIIIFLMLGCVAFFMALPLIYAICNSLKPLDELFLFPPRFFVMKPTMKNYKDLFALLGNSYVPFSRYLFNSLFIAIVGTILHVLVASMAAFPLAKHKFPGSKAIFNIIFLSLMFNGYVIGIPRFIVLNKLGWLNDYKALILPLVASSLGLYLMRQFMTQIPDVLLESARVDGAKEFRVWWQIVMPNVKPAWLTLALLIFQQFWGDVGNVNLYIHDEALKTLPLALAYVTNGGLARAGAAAAVGVIMMLPPVTIFILTQSNVIETMKSSGVKE